MNTFQTEVPHIYAAGDVIGFPALASTSMEQGRLAASHMFGLLFGLPFEHTPELFPYGIYTIPQISFIGKTECRRAFSAFFLRSPRPETHKNERICCVHSSHASSHDPFFA